MKNYIPILKPNLPAGTVSHAVVSGEYPGCIAELEKCGVETLKTQFCRNILPQVGFHADMLFSYLGNGEFLIEETQDNLATDLKKLGFTQIGSAVKLSDKYPSDIALNSCVIGDRIICGKTGVDPLLKIGKSVIETPQGYAKCSVCVVDDNSIITDDHSIKKACLKNNIDCLLVRKGDVELNGFDYGFIGGCCGKIDKDTLVFFGDLRTHSDFVSIKSFLSERNVYPLSISTGKLSDIGSLIPIAKYSKKL